MPMADSMIQRLRTSKRINTDKSLNVGQPPSADRLHFLEWQAKRVPLAKEFERAEFLLVLSEKGEFHGFGSPKRH